MTIFINGTAMSTTLTTAGTYTKMSNTTAPLYIGSWAVGDLYFKGSIDEVRIYNRALTADEIKQLYRMGATPKGIK
jgi:hypothetical protein